MSDAPVWLAALVALPAFVIGASFLAVEVERLRLAAVASALAMVLTALFAIGVALLIGPGAQHTVVETAAMWLIVVAALLRKGIVPFHAWLPEVFDRGRLGPVILFNAPQVGAYITVVLIVPRASPEM